MKLSSPVFENGQSIPALFTHDGDNISPPLHWSDAPKGTQSFAMIVEDPDAPSGVFTHWVIYNLPPVMQALDREVPEGGRYGSQAFQGMNDFHRIGYGGPQPPQGEHRYFFTLYALDTVLNLQQGVSKNKLLKAMEGHILDKAELMGRYEKQDQPDIARELAEEREHEDAYDLSVHDNKLQPEDGRYDQSDELLRNE